MNGGQFIPAKGGQGHWFFQLPDIAYHILTLILSGTHKDSPCFTEKAS
jgi:hypothetical protein